MKPILKCELKIDRVYFIPIFQHKSTV